MLCFKSKENELISKKAAEFEKCAQEANMNLVTLEKENSRLSDEKQQVAEVCFWFLVTLSV